jgi:hypothetical protein
VPRTRHARHAGDLVFNIALGATLVALPLTVGAIARAAFVKFRFTDKRVSVVTTAPWESECVGARGAGSGCAGCACSVGRPRWRRVGALRTHTTTRMLPA